MTLFSNAGSLKKQKDKVPPTLPLSVLEPFLRRFFPFCSCGKVMSENFRIETLLVTVVSGLSDRFSRQPLLLTATPLTDRGPPP